MKLQDIVARRAVIARPLIGGDAVLARQVQKRLGELALLDPPVDVQFGPVSHWALSQFLALSGFAQNAPIDALIARELLDADTDTLLPIRRGASFASRLVDAALARGFWLARHPDCINILYVEGMDPDGTPNDDAPNVFNDVRVALRLSRNGTPLVEGVWDATTEPGDYYTRVKKLDPRGAARIALGQYKSWTVGTHMAGRASAHEALVQVADVRVYRDLNEDFQREKDREFTGVFGINQHCGYDLPRGDIGRASAGCLVGRTRGGHREFMRLVKSDARYRANHGYRFMTGVLAASAPS
jgi:hypothetical protein